MVMEAPRTATFMKEPTLVTTEIDMHPEKATTFSYNRRDYLLIPDSKKTLVAVAFGDYTVYASKLGLQSFSEEQVRYVISLLSRIPSEVITIKDINRVANFAHEAGNPKTVGIDEVVFSKFLTGLVTKLNAQKTAYIGA